MTGVGLIVVVTDGTSSMQQYLDKSTSLVTFYHPRRITSALICCRFQLNSITRATILALAVGHRSDVHLDTSTGRSLKDEQLISILGYSQISNMYRWCRDHVSLMC